MPYNKTNWKDLPDVSTPINAARLNKLETQYEEAVSDATAVAASYTDTAIAAADRARDEADRAEDARDAAVEARDEAVFAAEHSGNLASATAETIPAADPAGVALSGPMNARNAHFRIPRGLPGVNAVENDEAVATYLATGGTLTHAAAQELTVRVTGAIFNARLAGAKGDGTHDDGPLLNAAMAQVASVGGGDFYIPSGRYNTSVPLVQPPKVNVRCDPGTRIVATAAMDTLWTLYSPAWGASGAGWAYEGVLRGGVFDCAARCNVGIDLTGFKGFTLASVTVKNFMTDAIRVGTSTEHSSYEANLVDIRIDRDPSMVNPPGSRGLVMLASDSWTDHVVIRGAETGVLNDASSNLFSYVHVWSWEMGGTNLHKWSFVDRKESAGYFFCDADTPERAGWLIGGAKTSITKCRVFLNGFAADNATTGVSILYPGSQPKLQHMSFVSASPTRKLAADVGGPTVPRPAWFIVTVEPSFDWTVTEPYLDALSPTIVGTTYTGPNPTIKRIEHDLIVGPIKAKALEILTGRSSKAVRYLRDNGSTVYQFNDVGDSPIESHNLGLSSRWFRGNWAQETVRIDGALGRIQLGAPDTGRNVQLQSNGSNPAAAATQPSSSERVWDFSSDGKIRFWDGTAWVEKV